MSFLIPALPAWLTAPTPSSSKATVQDEGDDDSPPQFPLLNSAQRSRGAQSSSTTQAYSEPTPTFEIEEPDIDDDEEDEGPPTPKAKPATLNTTSSSLKTPLTTTTKPNPELKKRQKVALAPGCSPLDWAKLKSSGQDLRHLPPGSNPMGYLRVTMDELKKHNTKDDAWSAFGGKVYNITEYARFHPGGEKELMRVAGRDGTKLFMLTHAWVNVDFMMDNCMVGFLVSG